jgi:malate dehydrogenase (oxaloacetate-decarboxylating)
MTDIYKQSLNKHKEWQGKLNVVPKMPIKTKEDLSLAYTPGVAEPCRAITKDKQAVYDYTIKKNTVAVITDGSAVLGLGNIGPEAALPVMEGKCALFKEFADVNAFPICLATQNKEEIIQTIKNIAPVFGGINLEDISAPACFEIEEALQDIGIPVMHDDQHGTAIVVLAALINASKVVQKPMQDLTIIISGAGAAGIAITRILIDKTKNIILCDSKGVISKDRDNLAEYKKVVLEITNKEKKSGSLSDALQGADVFIGVSAPGTVTEDMIQSMNDGAIVFAMANPEPEIMPDHAKKAGAAVVGTGRSDFPNQINNVLAFPGIFRGALEIRATKITDEMKVAGAYALAALIPNPTTENILPSPLDKSAATAVAQAVKEKAKEQNIVKT